MTKGSPILHASVATVALALLMAGCTSVMTEFPLSTEPKALDRDQFEGTWLLDKETVISVRFASNGVAHIAGVKWDQDQFELQRGEMIVTKGKQCSFLSIRFQENETWTNRYVLLQYHFTDQGDLMLWVPNHEVFEEAITTHRLQGIVPKKKSFTGIVITNDPASLLEFIDNPDDLRLFEYRKPLVIRKIAGIDQADPPKTGGDKK